MGQTLSEPVVDKTSSEGQNESYLYGVSAMQGWRITMEDAHATVLDLSAKQANGVDEPTDTGDRLAFFGVYDGHGGDKVALFAGENVHKIVANQESFASGDIEQALKDGFLATDRAILEDPKYEEEVSGCTASVSVISKHKIWVANAGDSRTVLGIKGRPKPLSFDHKPQNEGEKARISAAGGFVDFGRVNGNLALSRAIGDFEFKRTPELSPEQQIVTAYPDVTVHERTDDDEFLVIACDGIWDCQSSMSVVQFVRRGIAARQELYRICENMMDNCLASNSETGGVGCDNMTMIIIGLLNGRTKEEWYDEIARRVAEGDGPCAPQEYAEFRGTPYRTRFQKEQDAHAYQAELDQQSQHYGARWGRTILLGDGTEVIQDQDEEELFNENQDLPDQTQHKSHDATRSEREGTPGPQGKPDVLHSDEATTAGALEPNSSALLSPSPNTHNTVLENSMSS